MKTWLFIIHIRGRNQPSCLTVPGENLPTAFNALYATFVTAAWADVVRVEVYP